MLGLNFANCIAVAPSGSQIGRMKRWRRRQDARWELVIII